MVDDSGIRQSGICDDFDDDSFASEAAALRALDGLEGQEIELGRRLLKCERVRDWMNSAPPSTDFGPLMKILLEAKKE
jgi:hypothetical protein